MNLKVVCLKCSWTWETRSRAWLVSFPGCGNKVRTRTVSRLADEVGRPGETKSQINPEFKASFMTSPGQEPTKEERK